MVVTSIKGMKTKNRVVVSIRTMKMAVLLDLIAVDIKRILPSIGK